MLNKAILAKTIVLPVEMDETAQVNLISSL